MKNIILLAMLLSGCATTAQVKAHDEAQDAVMGRLLNRIKSLEAEQNDMWVKQIKSDLTANDIQNKLDRIEYKIEHMPKEEETKCPR